MREDLERVRLVSRRFGELQGLRVALIATAMVIVFGAYFVEGPVRGKAAIPIAFGLAFVITIPGMLVLDRYYGSKFGRLVPGRTGMGWKAGVLLPLAMMLDRIGISAFMAWLVVPAFFSLRAVIRDWPDRWYHIVGLAMTVVSTLLAVTPAATMAPNTAVAAAFVLFGATYVPIGFLDHRLLVSLLHGAEAEAAADSESEIEAERPRRN